KVYFLELPKEIQERFHYLDRVKLEAERAASLERHRADQEQKARAILMKTEEQFELAEMQAAKLYQTSEKGSLSGQIFIATRGRDNVKLGAERVGLFSCDAVDGLFAG